MLTTIAFFLPLSVYFFAWVVQNHVATTLDWIIGIVLGVALNYLGVLKMIDWLKDENSPYVFPERFLVPRQRKTSTKQS